MAAASTFLSHPKPHTNDAVSSLRSHFKPSSFASQSTSFGSSKFASKSLSLRTAATRSGRPEPATLSHSESRSDQTFDVLVIGAGIIGLTIARQFLIGSDLSVAVIDKSVPCSGATGAGQGYIWMGHKTPGSDLWDLGLRSQKLWEELAESLIEQGLDPLQLLGWKKTGSLLVGRTPEDLDVLKRRVKQVCEAGLRAEYLSSSDLHVKEPELLADKDTGAAFLPDDCQLDARRGVEYLEQGNRNYASKGRYAEFYNHPVISLLRSGGNGDVVAIKTSRNTLHCKKAIVVAAGCWSGSLMRDLLKESEIVLDVPVKPRKGHLLVLENFNSFHLNHGLMEVGYVDHQTANPLPSISTSELLNQDEQSLSVSMTATMDTMGNIILGSSRQFAGFCTELEESIISRIWERAGEFFPKLKEKLFSDISKGREVRVGLRPYMPDGKPVIGPMPGLANVFLATGHEGGGLSLALGTAEMLTDMVLGNSEKVNSAPFTVHGRC
ncbi:hypothetical protein ACFX13_036124 [Malus domestica]|uniref:uncharacterized protein LOC126623071 isoform X1 n=1 Tax=Malus sylvestris TaxID=3752 RepID=UPI0010AA92D1|nr:uncharacterized protein LOC103428347 isoform X1 [Malus domestica]XP_050147817.1 uncharacterized protein LOC126623071 isoform X1 [Malus sylvestris]